MPKGFAFQSSGGVFLTLVCEKPKAPVRSNIHPSGVSLQSNMHLNDDIKY